MPFDLDLSEDTGGMPIDPGSLVPVREFPLANSVPLSNTPPNVKEIPPVEMPPPPPGNVREVPSVVGLDPDAVSVAPHSGPTESALPAHDTAPPMGDAPTDPTAGLSPDVSPVRKKGELPPEPKKDPMDELAEAEHARVDKTLGGIAGGLTKAKADLGKLEAKTGGVIQEGLDANSRAMKELQEVKERLAREAGQVPSPPPAPGLPPLPKALADQWGNIHAKSTLGAAAELLNKLAVIVPLFTGKAPQVALAAYGAAMEGWSEGRKEKAEAEMRRYGMALKRVIDQHQLNMDTYNAVLAKHGANMDMLKTQMTIAAAESGLAGDRIKMATEAPLRFLEAQNKLTSDLAHLATEGLRIHSMLDMEQMKYKLAAMKAGFTGEMMKRLGNLADKGAARTPEEEKEYDNLKTMSLLTPAGRGLAHVEDDQTKRYVVPLDGTLRMVGRLKVLRDLATRLDKKGLLPPSDANPLQTRMAALKRWAHPSDPDLVALQKNMSNIMVGIDRTSLDDKGTTRSVQMFQEQFNLTHELPSLQALTAVWDATQKAATTGLVDQEKDFEGRMIAPAVHELIKRKTEELKYELENADVTGEVVE